MEPSTLSMIETGKANLTEEKAIRIAKVLNVSVGVLFAAPDVVEMAALRMRKLPILTEGQLLEWSGPEGFEEGDDQGYLYSPVSTGSRYMFAVQIRDQANGPKLEPGDSAIFDAKRIAKPGEIVLAQDKSGATCIGRFRPDTTGTDPTFDVVPYDRMFPERNGLNPSLLVVRGVLAERRQYFPG